MRCSLLLLHPVRGAQDSSEKPDIASPIKGAMNISYSVSVSFVGGKIATAATPIPLKASSQQCCFRGHVAFIEAKAATVPVPDAYLQTDCRVSVGIRKSGRRRNKKVGKSVSMRQIKRDRRERGIQEYEGCRKEKMATMDEDGLLEQLGAAEAVVGRHFLA